ncbi:MAG: TonB-dependent receptor plug domain-containing protein, partial [Bacteroidota bacterium]
MRQYLLVLFFLITAFGLSAQDRTVRGTVTSSESGEPLPFVSVAVSGTAKGASTDMDGNYSLAGVSLTDTLVFRFVGYAQKSVVVGNQSVVNISLIEIARQLDEVVVTALGVNRQQRQLGYSTQKVDGQEIQQSNSPNIVNALTGKVAGVQISNPDGVDGGTTRIVIRGNNNISGNNQPLIVVDGVPMSNDPGMTDIGRGRDWGSAINNINREDVESINILKGGAASALYGARGANGVVLITTKKGHRQQGIGVSYNMTYKITHPYRYRDVQNKYGGGAPSTSLTAPAFPLGPDSVPEFPSLSTDPEFGYPGSAVSWGPAMNGQMIRWWDG